ncbi:1833_t:CDS:1, partial [Ambispora gerdemannii]
MTTFKQLFAIALLLAICLFVLSDAIPMPAPVDDLAPVDDPDTIVVKIKKLDCRGNGANSICRDVCGYSALATTEKKRKIRYEIEELE